MRAFLAAAIILAAMPTAAHEMHISADRTVDYSGLKSPTGDDCCEDTHCRPAQSRWLPDNTMQVEIAPGIWAAVPPSKIIWTLPESLREAADVTHACWFGGPLAPQFLCVFPEATGS